MDPGRVSILDVSSGSVVVTWKVCCFESQVEVEAALSKLNKTAIPALTAIGPYTVEASEAAQAIGKVAPLGSCLPYSLTSRRPNHSESSLLFVVLRQTRTSAKWAWQSVSLSPHVKTLMAPTAATASPALFRAPLDV